MRVTRRVLVNLVVFGLVALALVAYGVFDLLGNPFAPTTTVSTVLPSAAGLTPGFSVAYDGIVVGSVSRISLVRTGAKVTMTIDPGEHVPADVAARVVIANTLGQQEIELVPDRGADLAGSARAPGGVTTTAELAHRDLFNGEVLPVAPDSEPANVGTLVAEAAHLLQAIPPGDLNSLLEQAALAVNGQADNLRTIAAASAAFSEEFLAYQHQFQQLLQNAPPVLQTVTANASALQQGLAATASLLAELAATKQNLVNLLQSAPGAATLGNDLVVQNRANLSCLVHDLADTVTNLSSSPNFSNLATFLATNHTFFSIVQAVTPAGPAKALTAGDQARQDQVQFRERLLLPPQSPPAEQYATPKGLGTIRPGAACESAFGPGVPAVSQPGFRPADGGTLVPATAAEASVPATGQIQPAPASTATATADQLPTRPVSLWPLIVAIGGVGGVMLVVTRRRNVRVAQAARPGQRAVAEARRGARHRLWMRRHRQGGRP
ncbi:MlaD family protein [Aciditerrimonas ferrireducens]|uniref:MlaD family protein n=1 Tax=Aciditerrimonas ferrireducens TaxID=667306 RepID=UPI002006795E|nr:MlaD family protein [Aciditerrimonas ferrireducens]MCK4177908.1 MCE family protein [Aciditerrimonas ferrireducens]